MDYWQTKRGKIPMEAGKVYKLFGKIVTKDEYYYVLHELIQEFSSDRIVVKLLHAFLQTMQDFTLEPDAQLTIAGQEKIESSVLLAACANASYYASCIDGSREREILHKSARIAKFRLHPVGEYPMGTSDPALQEKYDEEAYAKEIEAQK